MSFKPSDKVAGIVGIVSVALVGFSAGWWGQNVFTPAGEPLEEQVVNSAVYPPPTYVASVALPTPERGSDAQIVNEDLGALLDEAESRGERILPTRSVVRLFSSRTVGSEGKVSDEAAELLQLTTAERAAADQAIAKASQRLQQLELARTELASASETEVVFQVGAFVDEGEAVRNAFREELLRNMDPELGELLWDE